MNRFFAALLLSITGLMGLTRHPDHKDLTEAELQQIVSPIIDPKNDQNIHEVLKAAGWLIGRNVVPVSEKTVVKNAEPVRNIF